MVKYSQFRIPCFFLTALFLPMMVVGGDKNDDVHYDRINLMASASGDIENDILVTTLFVQREGSKPSVLSDEVNAAIQWAVGKAKKVSGVSVQTLGYRSNPVYQKQRLSGWRVRQSLRLESQNIMALSKLLGALQERLAVEQVNYRISTKRRNAVEENLITEAIARFQQRAKLVTENMSRKRYRIVQMNINTRGAARPQVMRAEISAVAGARTAPSIEAGSQVITVSINGTIELQLQ